MVNKCQPEASEGYCRGSVVVGWGGVHNHSRVQPNYKSVEVVLQLRCDVVGIVTLFIF